MKKLRILFKSFHAPNKNLFIPSKSIEKNHNGMISVNISINPNHAVVDTFGGERGIRTLETLLTPTRFPIVRLRPAQPSLQIYSVKHRLNSITNIMTRGQHFFRIFANLWWAFRDSNPGPSGYEPDALTN